MVLIAWKSVFCPYYLTLISSGCIQILTEFKDGAVDAIFTFKLCAQLAGMKATFIDMFERLVAYLRNQTDFLKDLNPVFLSLSNQSEV